jgi:argonaute-like protein implicated in RNA metabolism and viral defense
MNIFGFLTALVVCITLVAIVWMATTKAISIRIIRATEAPKFIPLNAPKVTAEEIQKTPVVVEQELKDASEDPIKQMDAVIRSVNKMMGIGIEGDDVNE